MAKIKIAGNVAVIESEYDLKTLKTVEKYRPNALKLFEEESKTPYFVVGTSDKGSMNQFGIMFGDETKTEDKVACVTVDLPSGTGDIKDIVAEAFGCAIRNLNAVEAVIDEALDSIEADKQAVVDAISVL